MDGDQRYWSIARRARLTRRRLLATATASTALTLACGKSGGTQGQAGSAPASGGSNSQEAPKQGGTLAVSMRSSPTSLDMHRTTAGVSKSVAAAVMSRLLQFKGAPTPAQAEDHDIDTDLASSVESVDGVTWTVKLKPNVKFHNVAPVNGHAVEAEDVKATFQRALDPKNPGLSGLSMMDASQIQTPAPDTIVFKLKFPYGGFKGTLASPSYSFIFPREALAGTYDPGKLMIGSGPFLFDTFTPDVALTFKRNPQWYGAPQPYADALRWAIIVDAAQMRAQFSGNHLDVIGGRTSSNDLTNSDVEALKRENPTAQTLKGEPTAAQMLFFQLGDPASPFQDVRVRRAFSLAIDRDAISKAVYNNDAQIQFYVQLDMGKWALRQKDLPADTAEFYKFNPAEAKKLIQAAGMADRQFKLLYVGSGYIGPDYVKTAEAVANMLNTAGIKTVGVNVDYQKDFLAGGKGIRNGFYDKDSIVAAGISSFSDVDEFIYTYYGSTSTQGLSRLNDKQLDAMLDKARAILTDAERVKTYLDVQKYLADKMYTVGGFPIPNAYTMVSGRTQSYISSSSYGAATESFAKLWLKGGQ